MANRTPEEELEYRKYIMRRIRIRKKRRQVMIARAVAVAVVVLIAFLVVFGVVKLFSGSGESEKKTSTPTATPFAVDVPEEYNQIYQKLYGMRSDYEQMDDILLSIKKYPKELLELLYNNPETIQFVYDYLKHSDDTKASGKIEKSEVSEDSIPLLLQWDERWGYVKYGNDIIALNGCGPTCLSMVYTGLTQKTDMSPADIADFSLDKGYFTSDEGTSWALMLNGAREIGLESERVDVSESSIMDKLENGHPVIVSMAPGDFTTTGHFIVLIGISDDGKIKINDPNSNSNSEKEWDYEKLHSQIKAAWSYGYSK